MVYGIISQLDDTTTSELFRCKRIKEDNVIHINLIGNLINVLRTGDVVYVVSVNRFFSVTQFLRFGKICMENGISLHILSQPYLNLGNGKHWKQSVINQMMQMVDVERRAIARMSSAGKYTKDYWEYLCRTFEIMSLEVLAHTFSPDGILKRGN